METLSINRLIIIAAPSGGGKSFLIDKMRHGDCPELCAQLDIVAPESWLSLTAKELAQQAEAPIDKLILHYDLNFNSRDGRNFSNLDAPILKAVKTTVLTLCLTPETLKKRNAFKARGVVNIPWLDRAKMRRKIRVVLQRLEKIKSLRDHGSVFVLYDRWCGYLGDHPIEQHWLLDFNQSDVIPKACDYDPKVLGNSIGAVSYVASGN